MGLGRTGKGACCWLGLLRECRKYPIFRAISTKNRRNSITYTLGEDKGLPDVTTLEIKNRGIWAEVRGVRTGRTVTSFLSKKAE